MPEPSKIVSVFLSYARADDEAFVGRLYTDLVKTGFAVWIDTPIISEMLPFMGICDFELGFLN